MSVQEKAKKAARKPAGAKPSKRPASQKQKGGKKKQREFLTATADIGGGNLMIDRIFKDSFDYPVDLPEEEYDAYYTAFDMMQDIDDARTQAERVRLAKQAVKISPYAVDARLVVIESISGLPKKIAACREAVDYGRKLVGEKAIKEFHGELWGHLEGRPMLRAMHTLALFLSDNGQETGAIEVYQNILKLNKTDNQGVRYSLLTLLIRNNDFEAAEKLWKNYKREAVALWTYAEAAILFISKGEVEKAEAAAQKAHARNPFYWLLVNRMGEKCRNLSSPGRYQVGDPSEAVCHAEELYSIIERHEGFRQWLTNVLNSGLEDINEKMASSYLKIAG